MANEYEMSPKELKRQADAILAAADAAEGGAGCQVCQKVLPEESGGSRAGSAPSADR